MSDPVGPWLTIETDRSALVDNLRAFRRHTAAETEILAVVKADAYGHGLVPAASAFLEGGAGLLGVHAMHEARALRAAGLVAPILVLGPATAAECAQAAALDVQVTVGSLSGARAAAAVPAGDRRLRVHLKVETGVNRQGLVEAEIEAALAVLRSGPAVNLAGLSSHYADIEDTTDHAFAEAQTRRFEAWRGRLAALGVSGLREHMSCSAAALLWERSHRAIVRVGIGAYGLWPSKETRVAVRQQARPEPELRPALAWKVMIAQVRDVPAGETVGYGRTWKAMTDSRIAVLPVGYADGWPRALSGRGHVLVGGRRAPLVGRICMNLCMVDVTHVPGAAAGDHAVLLGRQGEEIITAGMLADLLGTIAYEVVTLPGRSWERVVI
ncbi:MAG: alanine racemase [bacterium]|nr:alanine racemase [bacterium]